MHIIKLHFEDRDGTLSDLVTDAITHHGATADRDTSNLADNSFNLIFRLKKSAEAFRAKVPDWALVGGDPVVPVEEQAEDQGEASDPAAE